MRKKSILASLQTRIKYEKGIAACSRFLIQPHPDIQTAVQKALKALLEASGACRIYIFENSHVEGKGLCMSYKYEVCAPGVTPQIEASKLENIPYEVGSGILQQNLPRGIPVQGIVEKLPEKDRRTLEAQGILSVLILPLFQRGNWTGFLGFDDTKTKRRWSLDDVRLLETGAEIISTFFERQESLANERAISRRYESLFTHSRMGISITSPDGKILSLNPAHIKMLGYESSEEFFESANLNAEGYYVRPELRNGVIEKLKNSSGSIRLEHEYIRKNGEHWFADIVARPVKDEEGKLLYIESIVEDITERKRSERIIRESLEEKEILLKEIHHRVKNNLQLISSMLSLQSGSIPDPVVRKMISDSKHRIQTMALIHEQLYETQDFQAVNSSEYFNSLLRSLRHSYMEDSTRISFEREFDDLQLGIDHAIPCGLIINELVTNSIKHAFQGKPDGTIKICVLSKDENRVLLGVEDNGRGLDIPVGEIGENTLGLQLVKALAAQLDGEIEFKTDSEGFGCRIVFPL